MDKEDKKRYFVVGSVYLEVATPLFQQKLDENYRSLNFVCLKDFLNNKAILHTLFHLRHRNAWCCTDKTNCRSHGALPLNHHQWKQLYAENPGPGIHNCFCKYTAKSVKPEDLDLSLCGLILFNCCNLGPLELEAVSILRRNKNDYLSHNRTCGITKDEYGPLMDELKTNILQLDHTKEDELIRIQKRPLDDELCNKYMTTLLNIHEISEKIDTNTTKTLHFVQQIWQHVTTQSSTKQGLEEKSGKQANMATSNNTEFDQAGFGGENWQTRMDREDRRGYFVVGSVIQKLDEIGASIQGFDETIQRIDRTTKEIGRRVQRIDQTVTGTNTAVMGIHTTMEELLSYAKRGIPYQYPTDNCQPQVKQVKENIQPYKLVQLIFTLHHEINLTSVVDAAWREVTDIVLMVLQL